MHHIIFGAFYFIGVSGKFWSGKKFGPGSVKTEYRVVRSMETSIAYIVWSVPIDMTKCYLTCNLYVNNFLSTYKIIIANYILY